MAYKNFIFGSSGHQSYGGAYDSTGVYAATYANSMGANGAPLDAGVSGVCSVAGVDQMTITSAGNFPNTITGVYCWCVFTDKVAYTDGHYLVLAVQGSPYNWIGIIGMEYDAGAASQVVNVSTGGGFPQTDVGIELAKDLMAVGDKAQLEEGATFNMAASVDFDLVSGTETLRMVVEGVDSSGVRLTEGATRPIIQPSADLSAVALFEVSNSMDYWDFYFLDFNGDAGGANKARFGLLCNDTAANYHRIFNCTLHNTNLETVYWRGGKGELINCECYGTVAQEGCFWDSNISSVLGCSFHDNAAGGLVLSYWVRASHCAYNLFYDNTGVGLTADDGSDDSFVHDNIAYGNTTDGFFVDTLAARLRFYNNTSDVNGDYGYNLDGDITQFAFFANNHAYGNTKAGGSTHYDIATDASEDWLDAGHGNNITGDPLFTSVGDGTENFTPKHGSPLLAAGFPPSFYIAGEDTPAVTNYAHIGAVTRKEPKTRLAGQ